MPLFKITPDDGRNRVGSNDPNDMLEFDDAAAAIKDAQIALGELAQDAMPDGKAAHFSVEVADEAGKVVYSATMNFEASIRGQAGDNAGDPSADVAEQLGEGPRE
jgi:hypothetical protein